MSDEGIDEGSRRDGATELLPPHVSADFYLWLWWKSEEENGKFAIDDGRGGVEVYIDDRIALRSTGEERPSAVLTGESPATTPEARAAVAGGKVPRDIRLYVRRDDRDYHVTLRGTRVSIAQAKLPAQVKSGDVAEVLYDRMFLYEELHWIVACLLRAFAAVRVTAAWREDLVPRMARWATLDEARAGG
ncbi:MAG: hypothetical protein FJ090_18245 [Deltaproteobacteria bacterium]|nr:hypothetical protein [Deltaproteobacteria bacterium]